MVRTRPVLLLCLCCGLIARCTAGAQTSLARGSRPPAPKTRVPDAETLPDTSFFGVQNIYNGGPGVHFDGVVPASSGSGSQGLPNAPKCGQDGFGQTAGTADAPRNMGLPRSTSGAWRTSGDGLMPFCVSAPGEVTFTTCAGPSWKNAFFLLRMYAAEDVHSRAPNAHDTRLGREVASSDDTVRFAHDTESVDWRCEAPYQTGSLQSSVSHHLDVGCYVLAVEGFADGQTREGAYVVHATCSEAVIVDPPKPIFAVNDNTAHEHMGKFGTEQFEQFGTRRPGVQSDPGGIQTFLDDGLHFNTGCLAMLLTTGAGAGSMRLTASNLVQYIQNNDQRFITPAAPKSAPPEEKWCVRPGMKVRLNKGAANDEVVEIATAEATAVMLAEPLRFRHDPGEPLLEYCFGGWWMVHVFFFAVAAYILFGVCEAGRGGALVFLGCVFAFFFLLPMLDIGGSLMALLL